MAINSDKTADTIMGLSPRHLKAVVLSICALLAAAGAGVAGYRELGGPVPATRDYVEQRVATVVASVDNLSSFTRQSRIMILNDKWWRLQEKLDEVDEALSEHPANRILRDQQRRLKRDQAQVQYQIDSLEK